MTDPVVFGFDDQPGIIAAHLSGESEVTLYLRREGKTETQTAEFYPFFFLSEASYVQGNANVGWVRELSGKNYFRYLCAFRSLAQMWDVIWTINEKVKASGGKMAQPVILLRHEPTTQYLMQSGKALFRNVAFEELRRLQIAFRFTDFDGRYRKEPRGKGNRAGEQLLVASLTDSQGWHWRSSLMHGSEKELLQQVVDHIRHRDPDVIEGHGIHSGALTHFLEHCERLGVEPALGRDGSVPHLPRHRDWYHEPRLILGNPIGEYTIAGRHIIDTARLSREYNWTHGLGRSSGAVGAAQALGGPAADGVELTHHPMRYYWQRDADLVMQNAHDEAVAVRYISERLLPAYFNAAQIVPMNLETLAHSGSTAKIEAMMLREYVRRRASVPIPSQPKVLGGGLTDVYIRGVIGPIVHADVDSLYPSLMIDEGIAPRTDSLGAFQTILKTLTALRIEMKQRFRASQDPLERARLDGQQSSFKILINSFYGYLGYARGLFNDYDASNQVTTSGQRILRSMMADVRARGGRVVEADTDGIYFVPPPEVQGEEAEREFVKYLSQQQPEKITISFNGRYRQMFSYKKKNYALLDHNEHITLKGSSLIARSMESFGKEFIRDCIERMLHRDLEGVHNIYTGVRSAIMLREMTVKDFARIEVVRESLKEYREAVAAGDRNQTAAYEAAIAANMQIHSGDAVAYYITGADPNVKLFSHAKLAGEWDPNFPDENIQYYLRRLDDLARKFEPFFSSEDFEKIFADDSLFHFDVTAVAIRTFEEEAPVEPAAQEFLEGNGQE
ncbi:MAG TPA: DNA polymerase domain-containing protein [Candidatus Kapabacteria bacterium]|nr:DNA polymerase domain-containing protein [Candidatus Kapabacteria bacterium]